MPSKGRRRTRFLRTCISRVWPTISKVLFSCATISLDRARSFLSRVRDSEPWARRSCQRLKVVFLLLQETTAHSYVFRPVRVTAGGVGGVGSRPAPGDPGLRTKSATATRDPRAPRAARPGPDICQIPGPARTLIRIGFLNIFLSYISKYTHVCR